MKKEGSTFLYNPHSGELHTLDATKNIDIGMQRDSLGLERFIYQPFDTSAIDSVFDGHTYEPSSDKENHVFLKVVSFATVALLTGMIAYGLLMCKSSASSPIVSPSDSKNIVLGDFTKYSTLPRP
jgi:hypothetical protein